MNPGELAAIEKQRLELLRQLTAAETALRAGLHSQDCFGIIAHTHMERAMAHISEAYIAINEMKPVRSVPQLVCDLERVQWIVDDIKRRNTQRV